MDEKFEHPVREKILKYRPDIDGLRAIAVLFVVVFHSFPNLLKGGFIGVDIFFVISGFLISGIILEALYNNSFSFANFYARRIKRIFPALISVLIACLIAGWFLLFSGEYSNLGREVAYGAGFLSNIGFWIEAGYFDISSSLKPLLHLWSLGVEEQFYFLWPVVLFFIYKKSKKILSAILFLLSLSFILDLAMVFGHPTSAFYMPFTRFWELMVGAALSYVTLFKGGLSGGFVGKSNIKILGKNIFFIPEILAGVGIILIFIPAFSIDRNSVYMAWTLLSVLGAFLLIAAGPGTLINKYILSSKALVAIGLVSYPFYLWHWPLLSFANIVESGSVSVSLRIWLITISFMLACITYFFIEKPIRHSKIKIIPIILCFAMLLVGLAGILLYSNNGFSFRFPKQEAMIRNIQLSPTISATDKLYFQDPLCAKLYVQDKGIKNRVFCGVSGNGSNPIFIIGDSHTKAIYMGYSQTLVKMGYTVINLGVSGCTLLTPDTAEISSAQGYCNDDLKKVIAIAVAANPKAVIISNEGWVTNKRYFEEGMNLSFSYFPKNIKIIWFLQYPRFKVNLLSCIDRPLDPDNHSDDCFSPEGKMFYSVSEMDEAVKNIKKKYPQIATVDPISALCDSKKCPIVLNNNFLYEDNQFHLSEFGSNYLANKLSINKLIPNLAPTRVTAKN